LQTSKAAEEEEEEEDDEQFNQLSQSSKASNKGSLLTPITPSKAKLFDDDLGEEVRTTTLRVCCSLVFFGGQVDESGLDDAKPIEEILAEKAKADAEEASKKAAEASFSVALCEC